MHYYKMRGTKGFSSMTTLTQVLVLLLQMRGWCNALSVPSPSWSRPRPHANTGRSTTSTHTTQQILLLHTRIGWFQPQWYDFGTERHIWSSTTTTTPTTTTALAASRKDVSSSSSSSSSDESTKKEGSKNITTASPADLLSKVDNKSLHRDVISLKAAITDLTIIVSELAMEMRTVVQQAEDTEAQQQLAQQEDASFAAAFGRVLEQQMEITQQLGESVNDLKTVQEEQGAFLQAMSKNDQQMAQTVSLVRNSVQELKSSWKESRQEQAYFAERLSALEEKIIALPTLNNDDDDDEGGGGDPRTGERLFESISYPSGPTITP